MTPDGSSLTSSILRWSTSIVTNRQTGSSITRTDTTAISGTERVSMSGVCCMDEPCLRSLLRSGRSCIFDRSGTQWRRGTDEFLCATVFQDRPLKLGARVDSLFEYGSISVYQLLRSANVQ